MASPTMPASCVLTRELAHTENRERLHRGLGHGRLGGGGELEGGLYKALLYRLH